MTFIGLLIFLLALSTINAQNECLDPRAVCINIRSCPSILAILRGSRPLSAQTVQTLRNAQCGFENKDPLVCCVNNEQSTVPKASPDADNEPAPPDVTNHPNLHLLNYRDCGPIVQSKIFIGNGNKTNIFEFPWMALIAYNTGRRNPEFRCGGTIISERYVLTAAHCVTQLPEGVTLIGVRVGDHDISKERDCEYDYNGLETQCAERYQDFTVESFHYHPDYTRTLLQNDIALIRLNDSIDFRPLSVRPICLPFGPAATLNYKNAVVTGWGATELGPRSHDLLQARLPLITQEQCQQAYSGRTQIWYKQLCAGGKNNVDSCAGDSGGPLQAPGKYGNTVRTVQHGIVSYGVKQCGVSFPGVYTRVAYYMDWILNTMRD
ncbi:serine protease easter-like [Pseudomyrmex gracilis]|uniref:serine protease easter-like n=1 Tax=Pseudomyrmex gracilis TaxID=219809 RepID=UPI000994E8D2|nr:serine protease easter-like [Pseudomyrmex gracilis]